MLTRSEAKEMVLEILFLTDYDIYKEVTQEELAELVDIAMKYTKKEPEDRDYEC